MLEATLFINVAISLALLANLDQRGDGEDKDGIDAWTMSATIFCVKSGPTGNLPTMPKRAVKMTSRAMLAKLEMEVAQPRSRFAAAGLGQVESVMKAGVEAFK